MKVFWVLVNLQKDYFCKTLWQNCHSGEFYKCDMFRNRRNDIYAISQVTFPTCYFMINIRTYFTQTYWCFCLTSFSWDMVVHKSTYESSAFTIWITSNFHRVTQNQLLIWIHSLLHFTYILMKIGTPESDWPSFASYLR